MTVVCHNDFDEIISSNSNIGRCKCVCLKIELLLFINAFHFVVKVREREMKLESDDAFLPPPSPLQKRERDADNKASSSFFPSDCLTQSAQGGRRGTLFSRTQNTSRVIQFLLLLFFFFISFKMLRQFQAFVNHHITSRHTVVQI